MAHCNPKSALKILNIALHAEASSCIASRDACLLGCCCILMRNQLSSRRLQQQLHMPLDRDLHSCVAQVSKDEGRAVVHDFSNECLREAGVKAGVPPFAVISSNTNDLSVGRCAQLHLPCSRLSATCWLLLLAADSSCSRRRIAHKSVCL